MSVETIGRADSKSLGLVAYKNLDDVLLFWRLFEGTTTDIVVPNTYGFMIERQRQARMEHGARSKSCATELDSPRTREMSIPPILRRQRSHQTSGLFNVSTGPIMERTLERPSNIRFR